MSMTNETGLIVGTLSRVDLMNLIEDCKNSEMRKRLVTWIVLLQGAEKFVVSLPVRNPEVDKLNKKIIELTVEK